MNLGVRVDTRIKENLQKYQNQLLRLQELDAKEPPTEKVAMDMLCDVFGYDLEHVFGQYGNNGRACDAVIKDDKKVFYVFECKRIGWIKKIFINTSGRLLSIALLSMFLGVFSLMGLIGSYTMWM